MTSAQFVFCLACLLLGTLVRDVHVTEYSTVHQESNFISAHVGDKVTLRCFYEDKYTAIICWYKQTFQEKPKLILSAYTHETKFTFYDEFKNNPRFLPERKHQTQTLTILNLNYSDSATYYCAINYTKVMKFAEGTTVRVAASGFNIQASVHQSASEAVHAGGSVTLYRTVHTGSCDGEHVVYWFKKAQQSYPGLIYTHGGRNDQCKRNSSTQLNSCVYSLPLTNLNVSHYGTYYCVIASCGQLLFGNGTTLNSSCEKAFLVHFVSGSLTTLLVVLLILLLYTVTKRNHCQTTVLEPEPSSHAITTIPEGNNQNPGSLFYASLDIKESNKSITQREDENDCVYSNIKQEI